jgi:hypothetical protein
MPFEEQNGVVKSEACIDGHSAGCTAVLPAANKKKHGLDGDA